MVAAARRRDDYMDLGVIGELNPLLQMEAPIWKLVTRRIATLQEIEEYWDWDDIMKANSVLEWQDDTQEAYQQLLADRNKPKGHA